MTENDRESGFVPEEYGKDSHAKFFMFEAGNKLIHVSIFTDTLEAGTYVANTNEGEQRKGATTELYTRARSVIEDIATDYNQAISYVFSTVEPSMKAWARDPEKGKQVFGWTDEDIRESGDWLQAKVQIQPRPLS